MVNPRIGGRATASPFAYICQSGSQSHRFPFNAQGVFYFFSARYALAKGIQVLGIKAGDEVLLPSYNCGVEIDPFLYYRILPRFYRIGYDLKADVDDLLRRLSGRVKAVLVTHFIGFPQPIERIRRICDEHKVFLIEDCAHVLLSTHESRDLGTFGDIAIFSLLKTLPVPNGGMLVINNENFSFERQVVKPSFFASLYYLADLWRQMTGSYNSIAVIVGKMLSSMYWRGMNAVKIGVAAFCKISGKNRLSLIRPDSFQFIPEVMNWNISSLSINLIANTDLDRVKEARARNFRYLLDRLKSSTCSEEFGFPIECLADGVCPLFFPILVDGKDRRKYLFQSLKKKGFASHPWWDNFHSVVPWEEFPEAVYLKEHLFGLPIHQDITFEYLDLMVQEIEKFSRESKRDHV